MFQLEELEELLFCDEEDNSQHVYVDTTPWEAELYGSKAGESINDNANVGDYQVQSNFRHGGMNMVSSEKLEELFFCDGEDNSQHVDVDIDPWEAALYGSRAGESINDDANMGDNQLKSNFRHGGMNIVSSEVCAFKDPLPWQSSVFVDGPVTRSISDTMPTVTELVDGSSFANPKGERKKILGDRAYRLKKNADTTINRLKLLCMQTRPENRDLLRQVNLVVFPLESDLQTIKSDIKDIREDGKEGSVTDEEELKEIEHKLDNVNKKIFKLNSKVKMVEKSLMQPKSASVDSMEHLKRELNSKFPELCKGETAIVEGQVEAETPNIPLFFQGTVIDDSIISISAAIEKMVDWELEQLDSPLLVECEAIIKRAKEAGFQEKKDAEISLKNILSIYIAFKMIQK